MDCAYVRICIDWFDGGIDVKLCKSERNWLKYISKEEEEPYFNVAVDKLSLITGHYIWLEIHKSFSSVMHLWIYCDNTNAAKYQ